MHKLPDGCDIANFNYKAEIGFTTMKVRSRFTWEEEKTVNVPIIATLEVSLRREPDLSVKTHLSFSASIGSDFWGIGALDHLGEVDGITYLNGWSEKKVDALRKLAKRWHSNGLRAGNARQRRAVRRYMARNEFDYDEICKYLGALGLRFCDNYGYGTSWLYEEPSTAALKWLCNNMREVTPN